MKKYGVLIFCFSIFIYVGLTSCKKSETPTPSTPILPIPIVYNDIAGNASGNYSVKKYHASYNVGYQFIETKDLTVTRVDSFTISFLGHILKYKEYNSDSLASRFYESGVQVTYLACLEYFKYADSISAEFGQFAPAHDQDVYLYFGKRK